MEKLKKQPRKNKHMTKMKIFKKVTDRYGITIGYVIEISKEELKEFNRPITKGELLLGSSIENVYFDNESPIVLKFGKRLFITTNTGLYLLIWDICRKYFAVTPDHWIADARDILLKRRKLSKVFKYNGSIPIWLAEMTLHILVTRFIYGPNSSTAVLF